MEAPAQNPSANYGPGDNLVNHCNIITSSGKQLTDLTERPWTSFHLVESMGLLPGDSQVLSGEMIITDAVSFLNEFSLAGDELIELKFQTPQKNEIDFSGKIYDISMVDLQDERVLIIKFCSGEKLLSDQIKIQKVYTNVAYSNMVTDIFVDTLNKIDKKKIFAEPTLDRYSLSTNNKSPLDAINWICSRSKSEKYSGSNYVFFEKINKRFDFVSIEKLVDPNETYPVMTYYYDMPPGDRYSLENLTKIKHYNISRTPNLIENINEGMFAGTLITNDLVKRQHNYSFFNYDESYDIFKSVNYNRVSGSGQEKTALVNNPNYSSRPSSFIHMAPKQYNAFGSTDIGNGVEEVLLIRNSQMKQITNLMIDIVVPGDSNRTVGEIVEIVLPRIESGKGGSDSRFSGRYLISKIKHMMTQTNYDTVLQLVRDSYSEPLAKSLIG